MKGLYTVVCIYSILFGYIHTAPHHTGVYHHQKLQNTHFYQKREKRGIHNILSSLDASTYSRSSNEVAKSVYDNLYNIVNESPATDVVLLLDSSSNMGETNFKTGRHFLAKLMGILPRQRFLDRSVKVAMMTYSISASLTFEFNFTYDYGHYREMIKRGVRRAKYQGGIENHGSIGAAWVLASLVSSPRFNNSSTTKIVLFATNGYITDRDAYIGPHADSWRLAANNFQNFGVKVFMIPTGENIEKDSMRTMASKPINNFIIPVTNINKADDIISDLKTLIRNPDVSAETL